MRAFLLAALVAAIGAAPANPAARTVTVHIHGFAYVPSKITVTVGTTVHWVNDDSEAHTVSAVDRYFDSAGLDTGEYWNQTFTKVGSVSYFCALHPYMKGVVVVVAGGSKQ